MITCRALRVVQIVLVVAGTMALGYWAIVWIRAERFQVIEARRFAAVSRSRAVPAPPAPASVVRLPPPGLKDGEDLGELEIPRLGLSLMVVEGVSIADLRRAAGHIPGTAVPWQPGNVGIAGHRDTFFRCLRFVRPNDAITLATLQGVYRYRVVFTKGCQSLRRTGVSPNRPRYVDPGDVLSISLFRVGPAKVHRSRRERVRPPIPAVKSSARDALCDAKKIAPGNTHRLLCEGMEGAPEAARFGRGSVSKLSVSEPRPEGVVIS
jgi:sortase A